MKKIILIMAFIFFVIISISHLKYKKQKNSVTTNISYLTKLAETGNMEAQTDLGLAYGNGNGTVQNYTKAIYWYNKAARQGYAQAQFNLGLFYENGWGVLKDPQQAIKWYTKAAEQGMTRAQVNLATIYLSNTGELQNYLEAKKWLLKAAEKNDTNAMNNLGQIYAYGLGVEKNNAQAEKWFKKAVALGSRSARNSLGAFYGRGLGFQPDDRDKVLPLIEASACQGYVPAQINLASFYTENDGEAPVDYKKAYAWNYVAFINGSEKSGNALNLLTQKMSSDELIDAKKLAAEYSQKYRSSSIDDDTYKSQTECRYP
ncbi:tetratricopeptide repeat protein [Enterobacter cloacae]